MAGTFDGGLKAEDALGDEIEQHLERMLDEGQAGRCFEIRLGFLFARMRGVVGRDDVDDAGRDRGAHGRPIRGGLDRWITFNLMTQWRVILFGEPEMVHAGFGGESLAFQRCGAEQRKFLGGRDVQDVQARVMALGQFGGHRGRSVTSFDVADARVFAGGDVFAPLGFGGGFSNFDARGVLAVRRDEGGGVPEDAFEGRGLVDKHIARRGAHEDLHTADLARIKRFDGFEVRVGGAKEEGVVRDRGGRADGIFLLELLVRGRRRIRVRHLHERRHATGDGRPGLAGDAGLMGQAGLAKVYLVINQARDQ